MFWEESRQLLLNDWAGVQGTHRSHGGPGFGAQPGRGAAVHRDGEAVGEDEELRWDKRSWGAAGVLGWGPDSGKTWIGQPPPSRPYLDRTGPAGAYAMNRDVQRNALGAPLEGIGGTGKSRNWGARGGCGYSRLRGYGWARGGARGVWRA